MPVYRKLLVNMLCCWGLVGGLAACRDAPDAEDASRSDLMVNLATVQSGPQVQADELEGALARQPRNAALYAQRASFRLAAGQTSAALTDIARALELDDSPGEYYYLQARALRAQGQLSKALEAASQASQHGYSAPELSLLVGETNLAARRYTTALDYLDRTLQSEPDNAAALFYKGLAVAATGDTAQALGYLQASLTRSPHQPEILHQLAFFSNAYRLPAQAAVYARRGLRLNPRYAPLQYDYGRQLQLQNQPDSAMHYYTQALQLDSTLYRADYRLGLLLLEKKQSVAAVPHLLRALRRAPRLPQARELLAENLESQGRLPEALAQYRRLVMESPGNRHWTYKVWKVGETVRYQQGDSLRPRRFVRRRPAPIAPLAPMAPRTQPQRLPGI